MEHDVTTTVEHTLTGMMGFDAALSASIVTERLEERQFELSHGRAQFVQPDEDDPESILLSLLGDRLALTDEAYTQACKLIGVGKGYSERTPISLMRPHLNYWFDNLGGERKALIYSGRVVAFIRPGTELYSTHRLMGQVKQALENHGATEIRVDKFHHDLDETQMAIVSNIPAGTLADGSVLYKGIQIQNSLLGYKPLIISGYLHRDVAGAKAGMISAAAQGQWDRRLGTNPSSLAQMLEDGSVEDESSVYTVYDWAIAAAGEAIGRLDRDFENVSRLSSISVGSHAGTFFSDLFNRYKVTTSLRRAIQEEFTDLSGNSLQDLFTAITVVSDRPELVDNPTGTRHIMSVAGEVAAHPDACTNCHRLLDI